jgi:hypothetical protein
MNISGFTNIKDFLGPSGDARPALLLGGAQCWVNSLSPHLATWARRLEFAGGLTFKLQPNLSFYAPAGYQFAVAPSDARRDGVKGDIGLRYTW